MSFAGVSVVADGRLCLSTTSAINAGTASGYHLLVVEGYSCTKNTPNGKSIKSRPFMVGGHRWCIHYYPNGKSSENSDFISLSVALDKDVAQTVKMQLVLSFIDEIDKQEPTRIRASRIFELDNDSCAIYRTFMKREALEKSKYLKDDRFTVRCNIIVIDGVRTGDSVPLVVVPPSDMQQHLSDLLQAKEGADVTFEVDSETVTAHRCMLAARSTVFKAELFGPMKEGTTTSVIQIKDMEANVFRALLSFIYTDSLPKMEMNNMELEEEVVEEEVMWLQHMLVAADRYDLQRLKLICQEKLCEHIDMSTVADILALAEQHHCRGLKVACLEFLKSPNNLYQVLMVNGLDHITRTCPSVLKELLSKFAYEA